ncbi:MULTISPECIES: NAD(P)H-binding protein [unclassified Streptomyces]|uniref:NAD(P)H-binding protein n=1 Tax=unclassified Streptomyces TaxID=2593676 RepID=UPI0022B61F6B|nr:MULTISPECIES: NAD(P)H-binding protein [unclassified Streptomyces]MCZ7414132.1 NAD(P)H-binding protein [Streptomyces sp. WMMC897]MCZ7431151.1 NAD(P)H-binding protein [Streptomyces sp. WMMC1477]
MNTNDIISASTDDATNGGLVLVTNGTGRTGRRLVDRLRSEGVPVRAGSRSGHPPFDWHDAATWPGALEGVSRVYLAYAPDLGAPEVPDVVRDFTEAAAGAGVRQVVMLSMRGRNAERPTEVSARATERAVRESGLTWTVLRAAWFFQNFSELDAFREPLRGGGLALPTGDGPEAFVDVEDVADVASAVLRAPAAHAGRTYELSGDRLLSFWDAVAEIAAATGREVREQRLTMAEFGASLSELGLHGAEVDLVCELLDRVRDGEMAYVSDGVREVLGRPPRGFAEFAGRAAGRGTWDR